MNMNTEKKQTYSRNRLAVAIVAILLLGVAMIGIGYATASHTSTMTDSEDTAKTTYLTLNNSESDASYVGHFTNDIVYNTVNEKETITYAAQSTESITVDGNTHTTVKLGSKTIIVNQTGTLSDYTLNVKANSALNGAYYVGFTIGDSTKYVSYNESGATYANIDAAASTTIEVTLYIIVNSTSTDEPTGGYDKTTFTFTATTV